MSSSNYNNTSARLDWADTYAKTAKAYGMPIVLWDNNAESNPSDPSEAHGYLNRSNLTWYEGSSQVADKLISSYNSDSIAFGSDAIAPTYTHSDANSGTKLGGSYSLDASVEDGNCTQFFDFSWSMANGKELAVKFTGETPKAAMMDSSWNNWTDLDPYEVKDGVAYYSVDELKAKWSASSDPAHIGFAIYSGTSNITSITMIDAPQVSQGGSLVIDDPVEDPTENPTEKPSEQQPSSGNPGNTELFDDIVYGDLTGDNVVGTGDAVLLSKYISNKNSYPLNAKQLKAADVTHDEKVDTPDLLLIIEFIIGKVTKF